MITKAFVEHYKSLEKFDAPLRRLTVLVGRNGSGKSNFIDAIRLARDAVVLGLDRAISERHGIDSIRQWSPSKPYLVTIRLHVKTVHGNGYLGFALASKRGNHSVRREEGGWLDRSYSRDADGSVMVRTHGQHEVQAVAEQAEELFLRQFDAREFRALARAVSSFEAYSIYPNILRTPQKSSSDSQLSSTADNLTSIFKMLTRSKRQSHVLARSEIIESMRAVMPALENIRVQSLGGLMVPVFRVKEGDGRAHDFNVSQVSDGTLRVLGLLTAMYQPFRPAVLAMEEPEQTVNPGIIAVLADAMKEVSMRSQILITTHSPDLVDKFDDPESVLAVDMVDGLTRMGSVTEDQRQAVKDRLFTLGELMSIEGLHQ